jgi:hypothetical protein
LLQSVNLTAPVQGWPALGLKSGALSVDLFRIGRHELV